MHIARALSSATRIENCILLWGNCDKNKVLGTDSGFRKKGDETAWFSWNMRGLAEFEVEWAIGKTVNHKQTF